MKRLVIAAALAAVSAAPAAAQSYYSRTHLPGLRPTSAVSYDGTWTSGAWTASGSCVNGIQPETRTVTCSGSNCDPATKPATTRSTTTCTKPSSCGSNMLEGGSFQGQRIVASRTVFPTRAESLAWCETVANITGCQANASTVFAISNSTAQYTPSPFDSAKWSALCVRN